MRVLPASTIGTLLDLETFRIAVALRVSVDICVPHICQCGQTMDARKLSCRYCAERHPGHAAINDVVKRASRSADIFFILEPIGIDRGDSEGPDGHTIHLFSIEQCLCRESTCSDIFAETFLNN